LYRVNYQHDGSRRRAPNECEGSTRQRCHARKLRPADRHRFARAVLRDAIARKRWLAEAAASSPHRRSIVTISSANVEVLGLNRAEYCLAKTALPMMTKLFAVRLAQANIGVFARLRPPKGEIGCNAAAWPS
jgi:hypothetical protein